MLLNNKLWPQRIPLHLHDNIGHWLYLSCHTKWYMKLDSFLFDTAIWPTLLSENKEWKLSRCSINSLLPVFLVISCVSFQMHKKYELTTDKEKLSFLNLQLLFSFQHKWLYLSCHTKWYMKLDSFLFDTAIWPTLLSENKEWKLSRCSINSLLPVFLVISCVSFQMHKKYELTTDKEKLSFLNLQLLFSFQHKCYVTSWENWVQPIVQQQLLVQGKRLHEIHAFKLQIEMNLCSSQFLSTM